MLAKRPESDAGFPTMRRGQQFVYRKHLFAEEALRFPPQVGGVIANSYDSRVYPLLQYRDGVTADEQRFGQGVDVPF